MACGGVVSADRCPGQGSGHWKIATFREYGLCIRTRFKASLQYAFGKGLSILKSLGMQRG